MTERGAGGQRGLGWLTGRTERIDIPEERSDEVREMAKLTRDFVTREVVPVIERMEHGELELNATLMRKLGELGPLAVEVPEEYGGLELPKAVGTAVVEELAPTGGFAVTYAAHTTIGTLPLVYFGTDEQKRRYLPRLASGEWVGAYALTEPGSGSDALNARTRATLSKDGTHYILNGTKQFITNSAFAGLFTVFAKVDGEHFTGFLVEPDFPGVSLGDEEHKMGIKSSSTRQLILQDAQVPVENLLGDVGKGHRIALNVLNIARFKLGVAGIGGSKGALALSARYAQEREQFGKQIASFGMIRQKLAEMATHTYAAESAAYRLVGQIDRAIEGKTGTTAVLSGIQEYAAECAILKVLGTETLDYCVDEGVQIHGGYGFLQDYPIERAYRDSRINRLFEGTNEINRLLAPSTLIRKAAKGELALSELAAQTPPADGNIEQQQIDDLKHLTLLLASLTLDRFGKNAEEEQEVLATIGDILIETYAAESAVLRAEQTGNPLWHSMARIYLDVTLDRARTRANTIAPRITSDVTGTIQRIAQLTTREPRDLIAVQREIADSVLAANGYPAAVYASVTA
ncbi:MAG TPA: acyl-CoA dehydrogenase family protein [Thermomicrobiales bacterium]|nr:acyl-CoA dehydrogenase family protein [Thermomicrobiales bacterium]